MNTDLKTEYSYASIGDPDCPHCHGLGYLRVEVPVNNPDFGKVHICHCRTNEITEQARQRLYSLSHLDKLEHLKFENFIPRGRVGLWPHQADSLEQAYNQALHFSDSPQGWLLIQGSYGCGKTHLAAAISNKVVASGLPTLFITVPDLLDSLRFSYNSQETTFEERFDQVRSIPLLILDDFGTQNTTPWAQEKLFQILNHRYINRLPLVVTTNLSLDSIEGRIRSRLEDPELVTIVRIIAPDFRRPTSDLGEHELSTLDLLHHMTFASFESRQGEGLSKDELNNLDKAVKTARVFAEHPKGWLMITGPFGCGKTHLSAAIGNFRKDLGEAPMFIVVPDLLDHLRATFSPTSTISLDRRFEEVRTTTFLILDDLGTQAMTPWVKEKLYQLFNHRYNAELPTVINTSDNLDEIDPRLRSRFLDQRICRIFAITAPSYTGRKPRKH